MTSWTRDPTWCGSERHRSRNTTIDLAANVRWAFQPRRRFERMRRILQSVQGGELAEERDGMSDSWKLVQQNARSTRQLMAKRADDKNKALAKAAAEAL